MSTHKRGFTIASSGAAGGTSTCEQLPFVSRLAVDDPSGLLQEPWAEHLRACAVCREEAAGHSRALAVFRSIENELLAGESSTLAWESVQAAIQRGETAAQTRARSSGWWGVPVAATAAGVLAAAGVLGWDAVVDEGPPAPARIVSVEPPEQQSMEQVMRWMLGEPRTVPALSITEAEARLQAADAERPLAGAPEAREFAGGVSPLAQQDAGIVQVPLPIMPVLGGGPSDGKRRPPALPSIGRRGSIPPLFRLEQRLILSQSVSLPTRN